jgi:hypothetical protein
MTRIGDAMPWYLPDPPGPIRMQAFCSVAGTETSLDLSAAPVRRANSVVAPNPRRALGRWTSVHNEILLD